MAYTRCSARSRGQLSGLGFSPKPPSWVRDAVKKAVGDTVDTATTAAKQAAADALKRAQDRVSPPTAPSPVEQVNNAVNAIPGGWLTVALGVGALLFLGERRG